jgi:hypothetical protein
MRYPTTMMHLSLLRQRRELLGVGGNSGRSNTATIAELVVFNFVQQQLVYQHSDWRLVLSIHTITYYHKSGSTRLLLLHSDLSQPLLPN